MLSRSLNYHKPKSEWVWTSSSLSTQGIFQFTKNILLHKKFISTVQKFFSNQINYRLPRIVWAKKENFCWALKIFRVLNFLHPKGPRWFHTKTFWLIKIFCCTPKFFSVPEKSFSSTYIHQPTKNLSCTKKILSAPRKSLWAPKENPLPQKVTHHCIKIFSEAKKVFRYPKDLHLNG